VQSCSWDCDEPLHILWGSTTYRLLSVFSYLNLALSNYRKVEIIACVWRFSWIQDQHRSLQTREMCTLCSRIDMQTHAGRLGLENDLWSTDLRVSACRFLPTIVLIARAVFLLERGQTDRRDWTHYPTLSAVEPAWVKATLLRQIRR